MVNCYSNRHSTAGAVERGKYTITNPHKMFKEKPYDGMLVSRAILVNGIYKSSGIVSILYAFWSRIKK